MTAAQAVTTLGVVAAMVLVVTAASRWWTRRPTHARLVGIAVAALVAAVLAWMVVTSMGAEPPEAVNLGLGLLLLTLTVGSILQARRRLDRHRPA